jgi:hypothetical protein
MRIERSQDVEGACPMETLSHDPGQIDHVSRQVLVTIAVRNNELTVFPQRGSDAIVYYRHEPGQGNPAAPGEVRWVVDGLREKQSVVITAKEPDNRNHFPKTEYVIRYPNNTVCSGPPKRSPYPSGSFVWPYRVILLQDGRANSLHELDPDVEIRDVP